MKRKKLLAHPVLRKYLPLVHEDLTSVYSRDLQKWLVVAPLIGLTTGLVIAGIAALLLGELWPRVLTYYLAHHWAIIPGLVVSFAVTGLIMQYLTPNPDEHSTEEIIRSYHEHEGDIDTRPFLPKLLAAITTVGFGGSAALEGPSIYGGAAIGSWLWTKVRRFRFDDRDPLHADCRQGFAHIVELERFDDRCDEFHIPPSVRMTFAKRCPQACSKDRLLHSAVPSAFLMPLSELFRDQQLSHLSDIGHALEARVPKAPAPRQCARSYFNANAGGTTMRITQT